MKTLGVELGADKYESYLVTKTSKNIAKPGAVNPKYRAIVRKWESSKVFKPLSSLNDRMPHLFYGLIIELKAPMENKHGGSAAVNTSQLQKAAAIVKRISILHFIDGTKMEKYMLPFTFVDANAVKLLVDRVHDATVDADRLLNFVSVWR